MDAEVDFQRIENDSADVVIALHHNLYGNRMVIASGDHHLRVYDRKGTTWQLTDSWRGHDGEITDVRWNGPFTGAMFGSVGIDGYCNLWLESQTAEPLSGKRFQLIHRIPSKSRRPWQSLDFKNINHETYLALTSYDGNLAILEPRDHADLPGDWSDWFSSSDFHIVDPMPPPSEETGFQVAWSPDRPV